MIKFNFDARCSDGFQGLLAHSRKSRYYYVCRQHAVMTCICGPKEHFNKIRLQCEKQSRKMTKQDQRSNKVVENILEKYHCLTHHEQEERSTSTSYETFQTPMTFRSIEITNVDPVSIQIIFLTIYDLMLLECSSFKISNFERILAELHKLKALSESIESQSSVYFETTTEMQRTTDTWSPSIKPNLLENPSLILEETSTHKNLDPYIQSSEPTTDSQIPSSTTSRVENFVPKDPDPSLKKSDLSKESKVFTDISSPSIPPEALTAEEITDAPTPRTLDKHTDTTKSPVVLQLEMIETTTANITPPSDPSKSSIVINDSMEISTEPKFIDKLFEEGNENFTQPEETSKTFKLQFQPEDFVQPLNSEETGSNFTSTTAGNFVITDRVLEEFVTRDPSDVSDDDIRNKTMKENFPGKNNDTETDDYDFEDGDEHKKEFVEFYETYQYYYDDTPNITLWETESNSTEIVEVTSIVPDTTTITYYPETYASVIIRRNMEPEDLTFEVTTKDLNSGTSTTDDNESEMTSTVTFSYPKVFNLITQRIDTQSTEMTSMIAAEATTLVYEEETTTEVTTDSFADSTTYRDMTTDKNLGFSELPFVEPTTMLMTTTEAYAINLSEKDQVKRFTTTTEMSEESTNGKIYTTTKLETTSDTSTSVFLSTEFVTDHPETLESTTEIFNTNSSKNDQLKDYASTTETSYEPTTQKIEMTTLETTTQDTSTIDNISIEFVTDNQQASVEYDSTSTTESITGTTDLITDRSNFINLPTSSKDSEIDLRFLDYLETTTSECTSTVQTTEADETTTTENPANTESTTTGDGSVIAELQSTTVFEEGNYDATDNVQSNLFTKSDTATEVLNSKSNELSGEQDKTTEKNSQLETSTMQSTTEIIDDDRFEISSDFAESKTEILETTTKIGYLEDEETTAEENEINDVLNRNYENYSGQEKSTTEVSTTPEICESSAGQESTTEINASLTTDSEQSSETSTVTQFDGFTTFQETSTAIMQVQTPIARMIKTDDYSVPSKEIEFYYNSDEYYEDLQGDLQSNSTIAGNIKKQQFKPEMNNRRQDNSVEYYVDSKSASLEAPKSLTDNYLTFNIINNTFNFNHIKPKW